MTSRSQLHPLAPRAADAEAVTPTTHPSFLPRSASPAAVTYVRLARAHCTAAPQRFSAPPYLVTYTALHSCSVILPAFLLASCCFPSLSHLARQRYGRTGACPFYCWGGCNSAHSPLLSLASPRTRPHLIPCCAMPYCALRALLPLPSRTCAPFAARMHPPRAHSSPTTINTRTTTLRGRHAQTRLSNPLHSL